MDLQKIKTNPYFKFFSNKYVFIGILFLLWILLLDSNTWLVYRLNSEIKSVDKNIEYYKHEIAKDKQLIEKLNDSKELEKYAREEFFMKKENEDIYIIEHLKDSINEIH